jgi:hypothetical protein
MIFIGVRTYLLMRYETRAVLCACKVCSRRLIKC